VGTRPLGFAGPGEYLDEGWRFIPCAMCKGTGRATRLKIVSRIPKWIFRGAKIFLHIVSRYDKACGLTRKENALLAVNYLALGQGF